MRRVFIICSTLMVGAITSTTAIADYMHPGRIIIGYGGGGGTTTNAMGEPPKCVLAQPVECDCYTGMNVLDACLKYGAKIQCLTPDMKIEGIEQDEPVVFDLGDHTLKSTVCSGQSKGTAYINLPLP